MHVEPKKFLSVTAVILFFHGRINLEVYADGSNEKFQDTLLLAHVFFRHGDRSPLFDFPKNEINITEKWPTGFGQITPTGKMQAFQLGQFLRNRYSSPSLIRDHYHPDDIYMLTSDYDRTIITASSVLAGLYHKKWQYSINWDPIPLRTIPHEIDNIIAFAAPCPKYKRALDCYRFHGVGRMVDANYTAFYAYLANHTGISLSDLNFAKVADVFDTLYVQDVHKLGVPKWAKQRAYDGQEQYLMRKITEYSFSALTYNTVTMNLRGGPIMREIMRNIEAHTQKQTTQNDISKFKMRLYSGHDTTIATLLQVFGVYNYKLVPYTGTVIIELYQRKYLTDEKSCAKSEMFYIKFFYKNCTTENYVHELPLPDCQDVVESPELNFIPGCSVQKLRKVKRHILVGDWSTQCKSTSCCSTCTGFKDAGSDFSKFENSYSFADIMRKLITWDWD